eukprot:4892498-Amphidinium_carterae.1
MTITKIQTTHNPADVLTKHLPSATISSHLERLCLQTCQMANGIQALHNLRGLPTSSTKTIGMIGLHHPQDTEAQPAVAGTTTTVATIRAMRHSQAQQLRRRRSTGTPPRNVQPQRDIVARDNAVELVVHTGRWQSHFRGHSLCHC